MTYDFGSFDGRHPTALARPGQPRERPRDRVVESACLLAGPRLRVPSARAIACERWAHLWHGHPVREAAWHRHPADAAWAGSPCHVDTTPTCNCPVPSASRIDSLPLAGYNTYGGGDSFWDPGRCAWSGVRLIGFVCTTGPRSRVVRPPKLGLFRLFAPCLPNPIPSANLGKLALFCTPGPRDRRSPDRHGGANWLCFAEPGCVPNSS